MTDGDPRPHAYTATLAQQIEAAWQQRWEREGTFHAPNLIGELSGGFDDVGDWPTRYVLDRPPVPVGPGLDVGPRLAACVGTDVHARYLRMQGFTVLHPLGFDGFGASASPTGSTAPAGSGAAPTGQDPRAAGEEQLASLHRCLRRLGLGHDARRSLVTSDPAYYRWTQWVFLQVYNAWYDHEAARARPIDELIHELDAGRRAPAAGTNRTGRPWAELSVPERRAVVDDHRLVYRDEVVVNWCPGLGRVLPDAEVTAERRSVEGDLPVFRRPLQRWVMRLSAYADRLLADLDRLDWPEGAKARQRRCLGPSGPAAAADVGVGGVDVVGGQGGAGGVDVNDVDGDSESSAGRRGDWPFSRLRCWGEPIPVVYDPDDGLPRPLPERLLPLELPKGGDCSPPPHDLAADDDTSGPAPPLARVAEWMEVELDLGEGPKRYRRDGNTMPSWAGSSWSGIRHVDPTDSQAFVEPLNELYWMGPRGEGDPGGVDLAVGGASHDASHLLGARFWHKVLHDLGHVSSSEPFRRLVDLDGPDRMEAGEGGRTGSVGPDEICSRYGADAFRLHAVVAGRWDPSQPSEAPDVAGLFGLLQQVWRNLVDEETGRPTVDDDLPDDATSRVVAHTVVAVQESLAALRFDGAVTRIAGLNDHLTTRRAAGSGPGSDAGNGARDGAAVPREVAETLVLLLAPLAPHVSEELWSRLGHVESLAHEPFPEPDRSYLIDDQGSWSPTVID